MGTSSPLKIGLVLDTSLDPQDGVQQYVVSIGEWLRSEGNDIHYLVGQTSERDLPNVHSLARNISVRFNGSRTTIPLPTNRRKLREFLQAEDFDVLHVQMPHSPFMGQRIVLAADSRAAVIGTFHILPYDKLSSVGNKALGIWLRPSLKRFDQIMSVSTAAAEFARKSFGIRTGVLPNVIDYKRFHNASALLQYADNTSTILFLGRLVERKGCQLLLQALALLAKDIEQSNLRVLICGRGHLDNKLKQFVKHNGLDRIVEFAGFVSEEDKPRYYASADIAVFPSSSGESFGIVLLEAMANGRAAVLAGDNPGYRSVMSPRPDLLFNPQDAGILAKKLKRYILDRSLRKAAASWGESYSKEFDINAVGPRLLDVYNKALLKRRSL